jgi:hypothetical protein
MTDLECRRDYERKVNEQADRIEALEAALREINGVIGVWRRTPTADRYSTEVMRQALALRDIARAARAPEQDK